MWTESDRRSTKGIWDKYLASEMLLCHLLRDIFGNPFWPAELAEGVLTWNDGCVVKLATAAYECRQLPDGTLDKARLAVLADALEEAGCQDETVLKHLREQGAVHVRGCWVLDLLLGKV
jgi:hypothetical protein